MSIYLVDRIPQTARFLHICISTRAHTHAPCRPERRAIPHTTCDTLHAVPLAMRFKSMCGSSFDLKELKSTVDGHERVGGLVERQAPKRGGLRAEAREDGTAGTIGSEQSRVGRE